MKKILCIAALVCFAAMAFGYTFSVPITVVELVPPVRPGGAPDYATNTVYANGQLVETYSGRYYMCLTGGTSSNAFTSAGGDTLVTQGTAVFAPCPPAKMTFLSIANTGTNTVYVKARGTPAAGDGVVVGAGVSLILSGAEIPQDGMRAISANGASIVSVTGW